MQGKRTPSRNPGIGLRHQRKCATQTGGKCNCRPSYRAGVFDKRTGQQIRETFGTLDEAKQWRAEQQVKLGQGKRIIQTRRSFRDVAEEWLAAADRVPPTVRKKGGGVYKPSAIRSLERDLRRYVLPDLGANRLLDVSRGDLQALVDRLVGKGLSASKVRNVITAVRVIVRFAIERDELEVNPTSGLSLPSGGEPRERAASAEEAADLLAVLPQEDRALWATAFYGGLRRGELRGLRWDDVDLAAGDIHVRRAWDDTVGEIGPKSKKGMRTTPIAAILRDYLIEQKARTRREGQDFVFGVSSDRPFTPNYIRRRAVRAWAQANELRAEDELPPLNPIGLHECRHTAVSMWAAAGVPLERIGDYIGHSSTYMTDRYRHLIEGQRDADRKLMDDYFARADTRGRIEQLDA